MRCSPRWPRPASRARCGRSHTSPCARCRDRESPPSCSTSRASPRGTSCGRCGSSSPIPPWHGAPDIGEARMDPVPKPETPRPQERDEVVLEPAPIIEPGHTFATITDKISAVVLTERTPRAWIVGFAIAFLLLCGLQIGVAYLLLR